MGFVCFKYPRLFKVVCLYRNVGPDPMFFAKCEQTSTAIRTDGMLSRLHELYLDPLVSETASVDFCTAFKAASRQPKGAERDGEKMSRKKEKRALRATISAVR